LVPVIAHPKDVVAPVVIFKGGKKPFDFIPNWLYDAIEDKTIPDIGEHMFTIKEEGHLDLMTYPRGSYIIKLASGKVVAMTKYLFEELFNVQPDTRKMFHITVCDEDDSQLTIDKYDEKEAMDAYTTIRDLLMDSGYSYWCPAACTHIIVNGTDSGRQIVLRGPKGDKVRVMLLTTKARLEEKLTDTIIDRFEAKRLITMNTKIKL